MRKSLLTALCFAASFMAFAQGKYSKAKIVTTNGSTIDALIRNTTSELTPQQFTYTLSDASGEKTITVSQIARVEFEDGTTFEKHSIEVPVINNDYINRRISEYNTGGNLFKGEALVEKVVSGKISLYQFIDKYGYYHFFYASNGEKTITYLPYKTYTSDEGVLKTDNSFKNLLSFVLQQSGCESLNRQVESLQYNQNQMMRFFQKMNACAGSDAEVNGVNKEKIKLKVGLQAGVSFTHLTFDVGNPAYYPGLKAEDFKNSTNPTFGINLSLIPRKKVKNYVASLEAYYHSYKSETDSIVANTYTKGKGHISFSTLSIGPTVRFLFLRSKVRPFVELGLVVEDVLSKDDEYVYVASGQRYSRPIFQSKGIGGSGIGGAGVDFSRFSLHARYQLAIGQHQATYNAASAILKVNLN